MLFFRTQHLFFKLVGYIYLKQGFSNFTVHQSHLKGLLNCCALRPDWLFQLLGDSLRIVFDRVPNSAEAADLGTTL